jgi:hypothetical protein
VEVTAALVVWFAQTRTAEAKRGLQVTTQSKAFSFGYQVKSGSVLNGNNKTASCTSSEHWKKKNL